MPPPSDYMTNRSKVVTYDPKEKKHCHIMTSDEVAEGKPTVVDQMELFGGIRNLPPVLFNYTSLRHLYLAHNSISVIPPQISELRNLQYLDLSFNQISQVPIDIGTMYELRELHLKMNIIGTLPVELGRLFQLKVLTIDGNPLDSSISHLYDSCGGVSGTSSFIHVLMDRMSNCGSAPPDRTWRPLCEPVQGAIQFTLMCYNILCEKYASQQVYPYCPAWALNWVYRRAAILDEIRLYTADIICLQEVEMDQYELHFEKLLKTHGYSGIFSPKSRAHHMTDAERRKVDGCAIFWKTERFRLVKDTVIEFSRMAMERYENDCKESPEMLNRVMVRDNIALSAILETKESSQPQQFMVSTAHIHWDPEYSDVKLIQSIMHVSSLNQKIEEHLLEQNGGKTPVNPANMPLIVCGDFNSLPQSGVVEFLTQGRVAKSHPDFKNLGYVKVLDKLCGRRRHGRNNAGDADVLQHDFVLGRAYDSGEGMRYTNYTYDFKGIIDYIFYTKNHFNVLGNLEMVNESWLKKEKIPGCPHPHIPSDHFPLLVELELQLPGDHHSQHSRK